MPKATHAKVSAKADGGDATLVLPSDWNDDHVVTFVGARLTKSATQTIPNITTTAVTWDGETFDADAFHDNTTNPSRWTVPSGFDGTFRVSGFIQWAGNATAERRINIYKNGSSYSSPGEDRPGHGSFFQQPFADIVEAVAGDYIEVRVWQQSGGDLGVLNGSSASIEYLGA